MYRTKLILTWSVCSLNVLTYECEANSQTLTEWSELPETKCFLSGANATFKTHELWPDNVAAKLKCCLKIINEALKIN